MDLLVPAIFRFFIEKVEAFYFYINEILLLYCAIHLNCIGSSRIVLTDHWSNLLMKMYQGNIFEKKNNIKNPQIIHKY